MLKIIKIHIAMLALLVVWGCSHDEILETPLVQDEIVFAATSGKVTRAGETSLAKYIDNFRIYGIKSDKLVFDNYVLWYDEETTQSNTSHWEYVGYDPVDEKLQTIKYWDFSAFPYTFWAIAGAGRGNFTQKDELDRITSFVTYLSEVDAEGPAMYYSKSAVIERSQYTDPVTFQFVGVHSRVRFAFYETVPGYAVKNVRFHIGSDATQYTDCTVNGKFNVAGTLNLDYDYTTPDNPDVSMSLTDPEQSVSHSFGALNYTKAASGWLAQNSDSRYLGVLSSAPSYAGAVSNPGYYTSVLPIPDNDTPIAINVDYTLVALDKSGQEIEITDAKAVIPTQFCQWKPNYSYTYLFKISDSELSPITFEAFGEIDNTTDNEQGTITTVDDKYSITTHQSGDTDEQGIAYESSPYVTGRPIEVSVVKLDGFENVSLVEESTTDFVRIYHQKTINEWVVEIDTTEPVTPTAYENGMVRFEPTQTGTYRIEFWHKEGDADAEMMAVKIVAVGAKLHGTGHTGTDLGDGGSMELELEENATP
jgi:hypothetical protein